MLISVSRWTADIVQDVDLDVFFSSDGADLANSKSHHGRYAWLRGIVRDGATLTLGLTLTECAELYMRLREDAEVRSWAEALSTRLAASDAMTFVSNDP